MKVLVAIDRFENILTSNEANIFVEEGIKKVIPQAEIISVPLFDGRQMVTGVLDWNEGKKFQWMIADGHLQEQKATVAAIEEQLYIDAGQLYNTSDNYLSTSSSGLGQIILNGLDLNYQSFTLSLGDSFVFDGGIGLLEVLGGKFYDMNDYIVPGPLTANDIKRIRRIDLSGLDDRLNEAAFTIVSDNDYYLFGRHSQIVMEDLQSDDRQLLDNNIWYLNEQLKKIGIDLTRPYMGGEGIGLRALFVEVFSAQVLTSKELIFSATSIPELLEQADIVIFGGGTIDATEGSLVSQAIMSTASPHQYYLYLTAGRQLPDQSVHSYQLNVYPELTNTTEPMQIGMQLQNSTMTMMKMIQRHAAQ